MVIKNQANFVHSAVHPGNGNPGWVSRTKKYVGGRRKADLMGYYMFQGAYTSETWKSLLKKPVNRFDAIRPAIEKLGGTIEGGWFVFGEYDFVLIAQMPDNVSAGAFSLAVAAGGSLKAAKTTPLMTVTEGLAAMKKAAGSGYRPPGK